MSYYSHNSNNSIKSPGILFHGRRLYDAVLLDQPWAQNYLDLWNVSPLYGKVDRQYNLVQLRGRNLSTVRDGMNRGNISALNFVADAFNAMGIYLKELEVKKKIPAETFFHPLEAYSGWSDFNDIYKQRVVQLYNFFFDRYISSGGYRRQMTTFEEYLPIFVSFINHITEQGFSITRGGVMLSSATPHAASGLIIEVGQEYSKSDDMIKLVNYQGQATYPIYVDVISKFGFYVDLHVPWRLIANLDSPAWKGGNPILQEIVDKYFEDGYSVEHVFDNYYDKTYLNELQDLKVIALQFYNSYVRENPEIRTPVVCASGRVRQEITFPQRLRMEEMMRLYDDLFWLDMYLHIKLREIRADVSVSQMKSEKRKLQQSYSVGGNETALEHISNRVALYLERQASAFASPEARRTNSLTFGMAPAIIL